MVYCKNGKWTVHSFINGYKEYDDAYDYIENQIDPGMIGVDPATEAYDEKLTLIENYKKLAKWKMVPDSDLND